MAVFSQESLAFPKKKTLELETTDEYFRKEKLKSILNSTDNPTVLIFFITFSLFIKANCQILVHIFIIQ